MNEKFLSRGKREDTGKWVEGYYVKLPENQHGEQLHIIIDSDGQYNRVVPETVGRCTVLTDKNGKMIFEGDIIKYGEVAYEVTFEQRHNAAYFGLVYSPTETIAFDDYFDLSRAEIIGNIHDNPELIGGAE